MDHCQFPFFAVGEPMQLIDAHPTSAMLSDLLGGAMPVPLIGPFGVMAGWVRETCVAEDQPRNLLASMCLRVLCRGYAVPVLGPCAITQVVWDLGSPTGPEGTAVGAPEGFGPEIMKGITLMSGDLFRALGGHDAGFSHEAVGSEFADATRRAAEALRVLPLPDNYPYSAGMKPRDRDPVWDGLARSFGDGRTYVPLR